MVGGPHIIPRGEEDFHEHSSTCKCNPNVRFNDYGDMVVEHNPYQEGSQSFLDWCSAIANPDLPADQ